MKLVGDIVCAHKLCTVGVSNSFFHWFFGSFAIAVLIHGSNSLFKPFKNSNFKFKSTVTLYFQKAPLLLWIGNNNSFNIKPNYFEMTLNVIDNGMNTMNCDWNPPSNTLNQCIRNTLTIYLDGHWTYMSNEIINHL